MDSERMAGRWKQMKGAVKQRWGKLTDDDLTMISGSRDKLIGKLQERYGIARAEAMRRANEWMNAALADRAEYAHKH